MSFLDEARTKELWAKVKTALTGKQNKLTGAPGQVVGFGSDGAAVAVSGWSNPNLLRNWYFPDPVNQKEQEEYNKGGYTIDQWYIETGAKLEVTDDGIIFTPYPSSYNIFGQKVENYQELIGKLLTLSVLIKENTCNDCRLWFYGGTEDNFAGTTLGEDKLYSVTMTPNSNIVSLRCGIQGRNSSGSVKILGFKLEIGSQQTLAHQDSSGNWVLNDPPPSKEMELLKCQRYFYRLKNSRYRMVAFTGGNNGARFLINLPVTMAKKPALSLQAKDDNVHWIRNVNNSGIYKLSEIKLKYIGEFNGNSAVLSFELPDAVDDAQLLVDGYIDFDANL